MTQQTVGFGSVLRQNITSFVIGFNDAFFETRVYYLIYCLFSKYEFQVDLRRVITLRLM